MMQWEALEWTSLLGWHLRAAAVLAVIVLAALALRGAKSRVRHGLLAAGLIAAVVLPSVAAVAPVSWAVEMPTATAVETSPAPLPELPAVAASDLPVLSSPAVVQPERSIDWRSLLIGVWLAGVLLGLGRALASALGAWSLRRGAGSPSLELLAIHDAVQRKLGVQARLAITPRIGVPIVVGIVRPTILLPREAIAWDAGRVRAVLLHELGHVAQGDPRWFFAAHLVRALLWIDPLAWVATRMFFREAEYSADDTALAGGIGGPDYAAELLALARLDLQAVPLVAAPALGRPVIGKRIRRVLQDPPTLVRLRRVVPVLLGALGGATAVVLMRPATVPEPASLPVAAATTASPLRAMTVPVPTTAAHVAIHDGLIEARFVDAQPLDVLASSGLTPDIARQGHLITALHERFVDDGHDELPLVLSVDDGIPFEAVVDVMYTAGRAGWRSYMLAIDIDGELRGLSLSPPTFASDAPEDGPKSLRVRWIGSGFHLETTANSPPHEDAYSAVTHCGLPERHVEDLQRAASRMCELNGSRATPVIFAPAPKTPYEELAAALIAAHRDCGGSNVIEAGGGSIAATETAPACDLDRFGE